MHENVTPLKSPADEKTGLRVLYSVPEVAVALGGITPRHVGNLISKGELRSVKIGRRRLVPADAIAEYVRGLEQTDSGAA